MLCVPLLQCSLGVLLFGGKLFFFTDLPQYISVEICLYIHINSYTIVFLSVTFLVLFIGSSFLPMLEACTVMFSVPLI